MAQQGGIANGFCGSMDANINFNSVGRFDMQALASSGHIAPQTLAALHAELLGRPAGNLYTAFDQPALLQATLQGTKCIPAEPGVAFGQPLMKCQPNTSKHSPQSVISVDDASPSSFGAWPCNSLGSVATGSNLGGLTPQNSNMMLDMLQQQQLHQQTQQPQQPQLQSGLSEPSRAINVQPSCLVVPSRSSANFQSGNSPASVNQNYSNNRSPVVDCSLLSSQSNNSTPIVRQISNNDLKLTGVLSGYSGPRSVSPSASSCSVNGDHSSRLQGQNSTVTFTAARQAPVLVSNAADIQGSYRARSDDVLDQGALRNLGFVGKETCIPRRFAVDDCDSSLNQLNNQKLYSNNYANKVKQEPDLESTDNAKVGNQVLPHYTSNELMSVFT